MEYTFTHQSGSYRGKVRDVYFIGDQWILMIASDRISAFDVILPRQIPFKGQVLNQIAAFMLTACKDICPNWLIEVPAPQASIGRKCIPFKIEIVVRGNLAGHAWRTYQSGRRLLCGAAMPEGLKEFDFFPAPIITPSTKAEAGHDEDITPDEIITRNLCTAEDWDIMKDYALRLFDKGRQMAEKKGLILADTKYEFGKVGHEIYLMDEIHTPDSSRYFYADGFEIRQKKNEKQQQLSKEFVREWLIENDFMGRPGDQIPEMTDAWVGKISDRYIQLFELLTGEPFRKETISREEVFRQCEQAITRLPEQRS